MKKISFESGGLRAGLFRVIVPFLIFDIFVTTKKSVSFPNHPRYNSRAYYTIILSQNAFFTIIHRIMNVQYTNKSTFKNTAKTIFKNEGFSIFYRGYIPLHFASSFGKYFKKVYFRETWIRNLF